MSNRRRPTSLVPALCLLVMIGCGRAEPTDTWQPVADPPSADVQAAIDQADAAADDLGRQLMAQLQAALKDASPAQAIDVCKLIAPELAEDVGQTRGMSIGRTSFKLRNPDNQPPAWAKEAVQQRTPSPAAFLGPDGTVGRLRPITLMPLCVQCHGPAEYLAPDTRDALTQHYPEDQATGFIAGSLRGYFWAEVQPTPAP